MKGLGSGLTGDLERDPTFLAACRHAIVGFTAESHPMVFWPHDHYQDTAGHSLHMFCAPGHRHELPILGTGSGRASSGLAPGHCPSSKTQLAVVSPLATAVWLADFPLELCMAAPSSVQPVHAPHPGLATQ